MYRQHPKRRQGGAMRSVFWMLGLAAAAVALALVTGGNQALVTLFWPPYRFDVSFNFVLFCLIGGFLLVYFALRAVALLQSLPGQARRWRAQQVERAAVAGVLDALALQLSGRFVRSRKAALAALGHLSALPSVDLPYRQQMQALAHLLAAESAHSLQNAQERETHLRTVLVPSLRKVSPEIYEGALLRAARWSVEDRDAEAGRNFLGDLTQGAVRRIQTLRVKLKLARLEGKTVEALDTARLLAKHKAFSADASVSILRGLVIDALAQAKDLNQLNGIWDQLDSRERAMPELALAAAKKAAQLGGLGTSGELGSEERANTWRLVQKWLEPAWGHFAELAAVQQRELVLTLELGLDQIDAKGLARLEQAQSKWANNAYLQYLVGQACVKRQLWGKAAQLLSQASHTLKEPVLLRRTWRSMAVLAEERGDAVAVLAAWKKAAQFD